MCVLHGDAVEDGEGVFEGGGTDEGESEGLEVVKSLKISAIVFAHLEDGGTFSFELRGGEEVTAADLHVFGNGNLPFWFAAEGSLALFENPGVTYSTAADKDAVDTILAVGFNGLRCGGDVSVSEDGDGHMGVVLHGTYHRPVGSATIHLGFSASVDAESGNTGILQCLTEICNHHGIMTVANASLYSHRQVGMFDQRTRF